MNQNTEAYSETSQTSRIKLLVKVVNGFQTFTIFAKTSSEMFEWGLNVPLEYFLEEIKKMKEKNGSIPEKENGWGSYHSVYLRWLAWLI